MKYEHEKFTVVRREDGIIHVTLLKDTVLDIPLQLELLEAYHKVTGGVKTPFLFDAEEDVVVTKEARNNSANIEHLSPVKASAVVVDNLAYKIIANFYVNVNRPKCPYKVFSKYEPAIEWLKKFL